jgi:protein-disulfide isomerase
MSNTSNKHRNRKIRNISLVAFVVLLVGSFIVSRSNREIDPATFADVETYPIEDRIKGNPESGVLLVEYSDFQCPACANAAPAISQLVENFGDQFALEYRHFPLQRHPHARIAAQAAEAAGIQGKFWEMHDMLFEKQNEWSHSPRPNQHFRAYAREIGINEDRFRYDLESDQVIERVSEHFEEAMDLGLPGTPAFVFNGEIIDLTTFIQENITPVETETAQEDGAEATQNAQ